LKSSVNIKPEERRSVLLSAAYFFTLLASYYLLRPVRDEMGVQAGVDQLQWLFSATFIVMLLAVPLFGWASARFARRQLISIVYAFFIVALLAFYSAFLTSQSLWVARAFYVGVSVYNLFIVSVFWSLMADIYSQAQGKRLFGIIAAGGSAGAIFGPSIAVTFAQTSGTLSLLPIAAFLLGMALIFARVLSRTHTETPSEALGGSIWQGATEILQQRQLQGIALFIWLYTTLATFLYFQQASIVADAFASSADRTTTFAIIDLAVNGITVFLQLFATASLIKRFGLGRALAAIPAALAMGFLLLSIAPVLSVLMGIQIARRAGNYGITRPAREVLYTGVDRNARYKAKNFIDTVIYRGGDALAGWLYTGLSQLGLGVSGIAIVAIPIAVCWAALGLWLGKSSERKQNEQSIR